MAVLLGAKPPIVFKEYFLATSQTWTAPLTGTIMVTCTGGGGQGAYSNKNNTTTQNGINKALGGGAGGFSQKTIPVKAGDTFTVVVGAGGRNANTNPGGSTTGTSGGESTFDDATAISDIALDSNGGAGGVSTLENSAGTRAGGAGGTASGGDLNVAGGAGGTIIVSNQSSKDAATGGGAVSMYGIAFAGGNITMGGNANAHFSTGGAGCFGAGGSFVQNGTNDNFTGGTQGGGNIGPGASAVTANVGSNGTNQLNVVYRASSTAISNLGATNPQGSAAMVIGPQSSNAGSVSGSTNTAPFAPGVGNSGITCKINGSGASAKVSSEGSGPFAGGGGAVVMANSNGFGLNSSSSNGPGGFGGGGSGGFVSQDNFLNEWFGGGQGCVIVSYIG